MADPKLEIGTSGEKDSKYLLLLFWNHNSSYSLISQFFERSDQALARLLQGHSPNKDAVLE
jgi:hypothetical protein